MTSDKTPLVSIIITSYNRYEYLKQSIDSALKQDYPNIEVVITDNASTDNTSEILKEYAGNKRVVINTNSSNVGMIKNYYIGTFELATGEYILYLSSDDYLSSDTFISKAVALINKYENVTLVKSYEAQLNNNTGQIVDEKSFFTFDKEFYTGEEMFWCFEKMTIGWGSLILKKSAIRKECFEQTHLLSLDFSVNLCAMLYGNACVVPDVSYVWRMHDSQTSGSMNIEKNIGNYTFLDMPIAMAIEKGFNKNKLKLWRNSILAKWSHIYMYMYYGKDKKGNYIKFMQLLKQQYPDVYASAVSNKKWILFKGIMNLSFISFPLLRIFFPEKYRYYKSLKS